MTDRTLRLGDVLDDYCPRCRLLMNHDVATLAEGKVIKVTCRTCHNTHDYRNCLLYTSPSPRDGLLSRMPSSA